MTTKNDEPTTTDAHMVTMTKIDFVTLQSDLGQLAKSYRDRAARADSLDQGAEYDDMAVAIADLKDRLESLWMDADEADTTASVERYKPQLGEIDRAGRKDIVIACADVGPVTWKMANDGEGTAYWQGPNPNGGALWDLKMKVYLHNLDEGADLFARQWYRMEGKRANGDGEFKTLPRGFDQTSPWRVYEEAVGRKVMTAVFDWITVNPDARGLAGKAKRAREALVSIFGAAQADRTRVGHVRDARKQIQRLGLIEEPTTDG